MNNLINAMNLGFGVGQALCGVVDLIGGLLDEDRADIRRGIQELAVGGMQAYAGYVRQPLPTADQIGWPSGPPPFYFPQPEQMLPAPIPAVAMPQQMLAHAPVERMPQPVSQPLQSVPADQMRYPGQGYIIVMPSQPQPPIMPVRY